MSEWKPIKTAPKDGTRVLLYDADGTSIGHYSVHRRISSEYGWLGEDGFPLVNPTHWQPLPDPPKEFA